MIVLVVENKKICLEARRGEERRGEGGSGIREMIYIYIHIYRVCER